MRPVLRIPALVLLHVLMGSVAAGAQPMYEQLRIVAPAAPGGGWDQTARVMQQVLQQSGIARTAPVENVPGAAGTIGLARFIGAERGASDVLMVSGLIMLGGIVTHRSPVTLNDVTPIARLTGEYEVIVVPAASPFRTLRDVIERLRERPESISWGGGSAGGSDQILAGLVADAAGVAPSRINYIAFSGGGESLSAIVGGQVSVGINGLAELAAQIEAGAIRVLGISSGERLAGVDAPTLHEQGIDVVFENWRSVVAPPGITTADRDRLAGAVEAMVRSTAWRNAVDRYRWLDRYLAGDAFAAFSASEESRVRAILRKLGTEGSDDRGLMSTGPYPIFVLAGLVLCALTAAARQVRTAAALPDNAAAGELALPRRTSNAVEASRQTARGGGRSLILLAAGAALYLLSAERAGFIIASTMLFWLTARAFDERHPIRDAIVAVSAAIASYLLFARVLQLALPAGILAGWL
jgi:putative tricarboxylic transport membrane protein